MQQILIAYASHRTETLGPAARVMRRFDEIVLEEPPQPDFKRMLRSELSVADYVMDLDTEYPRFSRAACRLQRAMYRSGKRFLQVEPYLEILIGIHEHLAEGGRPRDFGPRSAQRLVYTMEHRLTGLLLDVYRSSVKAPFESILRAVKRFARADAARFRLRDSLRAQAIAATMDGQTRVLVEAGDMHLTLHPLLSRAVAGKARLSIVHLMEPVAQQLTGRSRMMAPGDQLTVFYLFGDGRSHPLEDLWAARSLIYNKLLIKNESGDQAENFPHLRDELLTIATVNRLSLSDCRRLYGDIRLAGTTAARRMVQDYLDSVSVHTNPHASEALA